jgi:ferric-dicitrate binding protein FerR (iron transport regulator)
VLTGGSSRSFSSTHRKLSVLEKAKKPVRRLWGSGKGKFTTKGKYAAATVRGTIWEIADFKDNTLCVVKRGIVAVQNLVTKTTTLVRAGHSIVVKAKPAKSKKK